MEIKEAYKLVLEDLMGNPLLSGTYDAKHGNSDFMSGIGTVMETIALRAADSEADFVKWCETWMHNLIDSEGGHNHV